MKLYDTENPDHYPNQYIEFESKDTFSLDDTLAPIIVAGLRKFLEILIEPNNVGGCPSSFMPKGTPDYQTDPETYEKALADACKAWQETIEEMIFAFECDPKASVWNEYADDFHNYLFANFNLEPVVGGKQVFITTDENEPVYVNYHAKVKELRERIDAGRLLFIKYFDNLWW